MLKLPIFAAALLGAAIPLPAQHAVKGEFEETIHAQAQPGVPSYKPSAPMQGHLTSIGADTMESLVKYWIEDFKKLQPAVNFDMEAKASGTAGPALTAGKAQLGPVAREMLPAEEKEFKDRFGYAPFAVKVGGGSYRTPGKTHAISFFVNAQNPIERLTYAQIDAMYTTTRKRGHKAIETWGDAGLKGEWAGKPVHLWGLIRPNGIAHFLELRITMGGEWRGGINERTTVGPLAALDAVVQGVAADPYAIGYAGFGNTFSGAKTVALAENDQGPFYRGTFDEVLQQKYPLSRYIYIYINRAPGKPIDPLTKEFLTFVLSKQGQEDLVKEGIFLPLPAAVAKAELGRLE
jgi:phosphate transport system substrate-binding protein